jgi:hypothetical protein
VIPLIADNLDALVELCRHYRGERLELVGSAAGGEFDRERSDLDFVVQFAQMPPVEHADCYFGLLLSLERLFGRQVDLLEAGAISNPYVRRSIDASRVLLYAA